MTERVSIRDTYDVEIDLGGASDGSGCFAYGLLKFTYLINHKTGLLEPTVAIPLENDIRQDSRSPRLPAHSDFWPYKKYTDLAIIGSAFAPEGGETEQLAISVEIENQLKKEVLVFGDRLVEWTRGGQPRIGSPERFRSLPIKIERAYGGCDFRVPFDMDDPQAMGVTFESDHPGLYPRNPWGVGYLAMPEPIEGMRLPNFEDPRDLLTDARLITRNPERWYEQPLPAHLGWVPVNCFPRNLYLAIECEPWFPPPDDQTLIEVQRGLLPVGYRQQLQGQTFGSPPNLLFRQEASQGLMLHNEIFGEKMHLNGLHPQYPHLAFQFPKDPPSVEMQVEHQRERVRPNLVSIAIYPDQELVAFTYTVHMQSPRPFIPGIHKYIPISLFVNDDAPVHYQPPPTVKERIKEAIAKGEGK